MECVEYTNGGVGLLKAELKVDARNMSKEKIRSLSTAFGGKLVSCPYAKKVKRGWASRDWFCTSVNPEKKIPIEEADKLCNSPRNWPDCPDCKGKKE